jgi:Ca2+-transporting ATPase
MGLEDPVRPGVKESIEECHTAGMRVIMITGDYPLTAQNIARKIGLNSCDEYITGPELEKMTDADLKDRIKKICIFARAVPEQKLRIVQALKANGEVVAMTGDGVNDSPALKASDIGIAMGNRGTDVAREASALVLIDDDFTSIVKAAKMGRRIFDNLKKAMAYIFAVHVPIAGMSLIPVFFNWPLALLPVHIVFLELIIDPACSVVFEAESEEAGIMTRPPRKRGEPLFGFKTVAFSLLQGLGVLSITLLVFYAALKTGRGDNEARALMFTTMIFANLGLILTNRSWSSTIIKTLASKNTALWAVFAGAMVFLAVALLIPPIRNMFHFSVLHPKDIIFCFCGGTLSVVWFEMLKVANRYKKTAI